MNNNKSVYEMLSLAREEAAMYKRMYQEMAHVNNGIESDLTLLRNKKIVWKATEKMMKELFIDLFKFPNPFYHRQCKDAGCEWCNKVDQPSIDEETERDLKRKEHSEMLEDSYKW